MEAQTTTAPVLTEDDLVRLAVAVGILPPGTTTGPADVPTDLLGTPSPTVAYDPRTGALVRVPKVARPAVDSLDEPVPFQLVERLDAVEVTR